MDIYEALDEIQGRIKPYQQLIPPMPQSTFSNNIKAIKHGLSKPKTVAEFMAKFGYVKIDINVKQQWTKTA